MGEEVERWLGHTPMTDPGHHAGIIRALPPDLATLTGVVQGVLIHGDCLPEYGLPTSHARSRATLPVAVRLDHIVARFPAPLGAARPPQLREIATCRDFALLMCAMLRCHGIPARLRCGFASYLGNGWRDHWVCEHWHTAARRWRRSDPQLDAILRRAWGIDFDAGDLPPDAFVTSGRAWLACRRQEADPGHYGHGETSGLWFLMVNTIRDHEALHGRETSPWDGWRDTPQARRMVADADLAWLDRIAGDPEQHPAA